MPTWVFVVDVEDDFEDIDDDSYIFVDDSGDAYDDMLSDNDYDD